MDSYQVLAKFYDELNEDCDYEKWSQYLSLLLQKFSLGKTGGDFGCGTGRMTVLLQRNGYSVFGLDQSTEMLSCAATYARAQGAHIPFLCGDMTTFNAGKKLDFITIVNDGMNYIAKPKLRYAFKNLARNLKKGGVLLFDISSSEKLRVKIGNQLFFDDGENLSMFWQNHIEGDSLYMDLTFFSKEGELYRKFEETQIQYIHEPDTIMDCLKECGFSSVYGYDCFTENPFLKESLRLQFVAIK